MSHNGTNVQRLGIKMYRRNQAVMIFSNIENVIMAHFIDRVEQFFQFRIRTNVCSVDFSAPFLQWQMRLRV